MEDNPRREKTNEVIFKGIAIAVKSIYDVDIEEREKKMNPKARIVNQFQVAQQGMLHSLSFGCFSLRKYIKKVNAKEASKKIADYIKENLITEKGFLEDVQSAGVYVNFFYRVRYLAETILGGIKNGTYFQFPAQKEKVMIEYSQPNTHKVFHVGHMRNVALGHSLTLLYRFLGFEVIGANYIGDIGAHIAKCLWYYINFYEKKYDYKEIEKNAPSSEDGTTKVEWLGMMYQLAVQELDFKSWTTMPFLGFVSAEVKSKTPHEKNPHWNVVEVSYDHGKTLHTVVCGGTHYEVGDIVAYAPVGSKFKGKNVGAVDKDGIQSNGIILGMEELGFTVEEELELKKEEEENKEEEQQQGKKGKKNKKKKAKKNKRSKNKKKKSTKIMVFEKGTAIGEALAEIGRKEDCPIAKDVNLEQEIIRRNKGWTEVLSQLESKEEVITNLWKITKEWCMNDFKEIYKWLGNTFDHYYFESDVDESSKEYVLDLYKKGVFVESHGAVGMDLRKHKLGFAMVLTSAGNGLYLTKDLELAKMKFRDFKIDRSLYVVDQGQSLHFKQAFKVLEVLGFEQAKKCIHVAYELVNLPHGKMSSRMGTIIPFSALRKQICEAIEKEYFDLSSESVSDKKKSLIQEMSKEEMEEAVHKIAVATIKYGMLNRDNDKVIVFKMEEWAGKKGNTGPYIMYAYTRTKSIMRKNPINKEDIELDYSLIPEEARKVLQELDNFKHVVEKCVKDSRPAHLCTYLYQLCQSFSSMYEKDNCSVFREKDLKRKRALLEVYEGISVILKKGLELLGIETLEYM